MPALGCTAGTVSAQQLSDVGSKLLLAEKSADGKRKGLHPGSVLSQMVHTGCLLASATLAVMCVWLSACMSYGCELQSCHA